MAQPKKLHDAVNYSSELYIPELDSDLDGFVNLHHEHLEAHHLNEQLKEIGVEVSGEGILLDDGFIDESQFE